jgi:hypothetical protein
MIRSPITPPTVPRTMPIFEPRDEPSKKSQDYQMPKVMTYIQSECIFSGLCDKRTIKNRIVLAHYLGKAHLRHKDEKSLLHMSSYYL